MRTACLILALVLCASAPAIAARKKKPPEPPPGPPLAQPDLSGADLHWVYDAKSACWAYFPDNPAAMSFEWTGRCKDHVIDGQGRLTWFRGSDLERTVDGLFRLGRSNGKGSVHYANGDVYDGELRDGLGEGHGVDVFNGGLDRYEGAFHRGYFEGQGTKTMSNGDTITGTFHLSLPTGPAVFRSVGGETFTGEIALPRKDPSLPAAGLRYPEMSIRLNEQGTAVVACIIGKDGTQRDIRVTVSSGFPRLDQAAIDYVTALHVLPATVGGVPVEMGYDRSVVFHIPQ